LSNSFITGAAETGDKSIAGFVVTGGQLSPELLLPAINYRRCHCNQRSINRGCHGIDENPGQGGILVSTTQAIIYRR
jgi:hypothetical protein